jgi:hypothetical protein
MTQLIHMVSDDARLSGCILYECIAYYSAGGADPLYVGSYITRIWDHKPPLGEIELFTYKSFGNMVAAENCLIDHLESSLITLLKGK